MTDEWNPTNDELRAIADNPPSIVPELTVRALARLVLREREAAAAAWAERNGRILELADRAGRTDQAETERDEAEQAERWKAEATTCLAGWETVWRELGEPGPLGGFKWEACVAEVRRRAQQAAHDVETATAGWLRAQRERDEARARLAAAWREGCFARDAQGDDPEDLPPNPYEPAAGQVRAALAPAPSAAPAATPDTETCRVGHDLYGTCELPYRHTGPHSRIPGGATEPNTWTGTTCQCQPCRETHGPADAPAEPTGARWWPCAHCDIGPRDDDTALHLCLCSDRCAAPHCNPLPASPGAASPTITARNPYRATSPAAPTGARDGAREEIEHQTARAEKAEAALSLILSVGFHPYVEPLPLEYGCAQIVHIGERDLPCGAPKEHPVHRGPAPAPPTGPLIDVVQTFPGSMHSTPAYGCRRCGRNAYAVRRAVGELVCWLHSGTNSNLCLPDEVAPLTPAGDDTADGQPAAPPAAGVNATSEAMDGHDGPPTPGPSRTSAGSGTTETPAGGVNAVLDVTPAMDGHHDPDRAALVAFARELRRRGPAPKPTTPPGPAASWERDDV